MTSTLHDLKDLREAWGVYCLWADEDPYPHPSRMTKWMKETAITTRHCIRGDVSRALPILQKEEWVDTSGNEANDGDRLTARKIFNSLRQVAKRMGVKVLPIQPTKRKGV